MPRILTCPNCGADIDSDCVQQEDGTLFCDKFCCIQYHKQELTKDFQNTIKGMKALRKGMEEKWKGWVKKGLPIVSFNPPLPNFDEQLASIKQGYKLMGISILHIQALLKEDAKSFATLDEKLREQLDELICDAKTSGERKEKADVYMMWIKEVTDAKIYFRV
jgi:hypothetical protein